MQRNNNNIIIIIIIMVMINTKIIFSCFELKTHVKKQHGLYILFFAIFEVDIKHHSF